VSSRARISPTRRASLPFRFVQRINGACRKCQCLLLKASKWMRGRVETDLKAKLMYVRYPTTWRHSHSRQQFLINPGQTPALVISVALLDASAKLRSMVSSVPAANFVNPAPTALQVCHRPAIGHWPQSNSFFFTTNSHHYQLQLPTSNSVSEYVMQTANRTLDSCTSQAIPIFWLLFPTLRLDDYSAQVAWVIR
jgi:hypothetical protein